MFTFTGNYTDLYQLTMGQAHFLEGNQDNNAIFDFFYRKNPYHGAYVVFAGLQDLLSLLEDWSFTTKDIDYLHQHGFDDNYLDYLSKFRFNGELYACNEGEIIFPTMPVLRVEANIIEAQLIETLLLNMLNFQSLIATKACRMRLVAGSRTMIEFGLRRAQGPGGFYASRAAVVGGFDATSNVSAGCYYNLPISGTMAHSYIQSHDDELSAFRAFAGIWPDNCVLLVDTYDTLESGVPNAIKVGKELAAKGYSLKAIRLDSGDLAYLSKHARTMLDDAGLSEVKIIASNQLDEYVIKSLHEQNAPVDIYGVGTKLVIGDPDSALDGVYKLAFANGKARIKLSESITKTTLPGKKQVYRLLGENNLFLGADVIAFDKEQADDIVKLHHPFEKDKSMEITGYIKEPLLQQVFANNKRSHGDKSLREISEYKDLRLNQLPEEYKRFRNPHIYKVGLSSSLNELRNGMMRREK